MLTRSLTFPAPVERWDEAVPLGNGLLGGLLWGGGDELRLSLDRGDLWDLRTPENFLRGLTWNKLTKLVEEGRQAEIEAVVDKPYHTPYPTKLPAGRLVFGIPKEHKIQNFKLDLNKAAGCAGFDGASFNVFFHALTPVILMKATNINLEPRFLAPESVAKLNYAPAQFGRESSRLWFRQDGANGFAYVVLLAENRVGRTTEYALTIATAAESADPLALAKKRVADALLAGYETLFADHCRWWRDYWATSSIQAPDIDIRRHYDLTQYYFGSSSRKNAPPVPLQGAWTADAGDLPPWKGDYHNDLNTQLTYWAYPTAGHFAEGESFLDFLWNLLPEHRRFAQTFYEVSGAVVPGVMGLDGKPIGGWPQYSLSPTNGAWAAHAFYLHWRYTLDEKFLTHRAIPYFTALAEALTALLKKDSNGKLKLALSSSPEIHNNKPTAWLTPNSNYDLAILRWFFGALAQMTEVAGDHAAARQARGVLADLEDLTVEDERTPAPRVKDALCLSPTEPFRESHRHHSHLLAIYPLGLIHVEGTERERRIIEASLGQIDALGFGAWVGYSFAWMSCMNARCRRAEKALDYLRLYLQAFVSSNGFHLNGDFKNVLPTVRHKYRPFTLEGNFAAAQAVHEMLLQSWGGTVRVFPAAPQAWADVSYEDLRAEGAFRVSARRAGGRTASVRIVSEKGGRLRLRNPFDDASPQWNRNDVRRSGDDYECDLPAGEALEGVVRR